MKKILMFITILFVVTSCELTDVLENDPPSSLVSANVVRSEADARALLTGVYSVIISRVSASYYISTETIPGMLIGSMTARTNNSFIENDLQPDNSAVGAYWLIFYSVIDLTNNVISLTDALADEEFSGDSKSEIIGEARFLRAMAAFDALRYFGQFYDMSSSLGIILRTEPANFTTRDKARSTVAESYAQIMSDLDFAIANAPDFSVSYRGSKTAAKALKAKVLLFQGENAAAASLAEEVINEGTRSLEADFASAFDNGINSSEMILMTYRDENSDSDQNNRKRFYWFSGGRPGTTWFPALMAGDPREALSYSGITVLKVDNEATYRPTYFMRLAEMYLIQAEALMRSGAGLAVSKAPLDVIRNRAGIGDSPATTIAELEDDIFDEIVKELAFENGSDWFAAIRFDKAMTLKPSITSVNQYILPIPEDEFFGNGALSLADQNPGYDQ